MNKHKRLLSFVLALVLVLGMFPLAAIAADEEAAACEECEAIGGHTAGCSQYVTPKCSECGAELLAETVVHNEGCSQAPVTTDLEDETDTDDSSSTTSETTNETTSETTTEGTTTETTTTETESTEGTTEGTTESTTEPATTPTTETTEATTEATDPEKDICEKCKEVDCVCDKIPGKVSEFVEFMTGFPAKEIIQYIEASEALDSAWGAIPVDSDEVPYEEKTALEEAESELKSALSSYDSSIEIDELKSAVNNLLKDMVYGYYDAMDVYEEIDKYLEEVIPGTVDIVNTLMEYVDYGTETYATDKAPVGISTPNIKVTLFNYGTKINDVTNKVLGFTFGNNDVDGSGTDAGSAHVYPKLVDATDGYPYISGWIGNKETSDSTGSLKYLFDKTCSNYISGSGGNSSYTENSGNYQFKRFEVTDLRLFQKVNGQYVYDSALNAAEYSNGSLVAYNYALRPYTCSGGGEANLQGHFLPFNDMSQAVQIVDESGNATGNLKSGMTDLTGTVNKDRSIEGYPLSKAAYNLYALDSGDDNRADLAFGMSVEFDFNMPKDGKINGEDMIFDFMGDDDVVVYVDGKPVLNIGGGHAATKGTINFSTGEVAVYEMKSNTVKVTDGRCTTLKEIFSLSGDTFDDYTTHTLQFFYLERFGTNANCWLRFNMEPIPTGSVTLRKQVDGINEALSDNQTYEFKVSAIDANQATVNNMAYQITSGSTTSDVKYVNSNGSIFLKANEVATFTNLTANTKVTFSEVTSNQITSNTAWTLNGVSIDGNSVTATVSDSGNEVARFICTNTRVTKDLEIKKEFTGTQYNSDEVFNMTLAFKPTADGESTNYTGKATKGGQEIDITNGAISLKVGESVTISGIPTDTLYYLTETAPENGYYDDPAFKVNGAETATSGTFGTAYQGTVLGNATNRVIVVNSHGFGELTITKNLKENAPEQQSFLFEVDGNIDLKVAITIEKGEKTGSVTIKALPYGSYNVKELLNDNANDWSWRYILDDGEVNPKTAVLTKEDNIQSVAFKNKYDDAYWLSGDCYAENWWGGTNGNVVKRNAKNQIVS